MEKRWNNTTGKEEESLPQIEAFLNDIEEVCKKHGLSISHEDCHGGFEIENFNIANIDWIRRASMNITTDTVPYEEPKTKSELIEESFSKKENGK